uniref:Uncharacterized protein n=1 Tax=uncultured prokaryote TaxID=198431 RepID=A0A0H5Q8D4_9ZZZZ|nr:hypothetical protein [uncultured prokaryote]
MALDPIDGQDIVDRLRAKAAEAAEVASLKPYSQGEYDRGVMQGFELAAIYVEGALIDGLHKSELEYRR